MNYVGIDPGQSGGIAWETGIGISAIPMPETIMQTYRALQGIEGPTIVCIESVHSMPKQGVASSFKFGKGYGELLGVCTALGWTVINPTPQRWMKVMLEGVKKDGKLSSIQRAEHLFPAVNLVLPRCRKAHDGMADALLLMAYAKKVSE